MKSFAAALFVWASFCLMPCGQAQDASSVPVKKIFSGTLIDMDSSAMTFAVEWRGKTEQFRYDSATAVRDAGNQAILPDQIPLGSLVVVYLLSDDMSYARQISVKNPDQ